jgi:hypothetical protein
VSIEALRRKSKAIEKDTEAVIVAYQALVVALNNLPESWAEEVLTELGYQGSPNDFKEAKDNEKSKAMGPSEAIIELLSRSPGGLRANEVIADLAGRIKTTSMTPNKTLYSGLVSLKRQGKIVQGQDGYYRLPKHG